MHGPVLELGVSLPRALQKWDTGRPLLATVGLILPAQLMGEQAERWGGLGWGHRWG